MGQATNISIPLTVSWPQGTPDGAPIARYQLQKSVDAGAWIAVTLPKPLARNLTVKFRPWRVIQFRVRAVDTANVAGSWAQTNPQWLSVTQETDPGVSLSSGWQVVNDSKSLGGRRAVTSTATEIGDLLFHRTTGRVGLSRRPEQRQRQRLEQPRLEHGQSCAEQGLQPADCVPRKLAGQRQSRPQHHVDQCGQGRGYRRIPDPRRST